MERGGKLIHSALGTVKRSLYTELHLKYFE